MSALNRCAECEEIVDELYDDPREPPLELEDCLCRGCAVDALEQRIDELEDDLEQLKLTKTRLENQDE